MFNPNVTSMRILTEEQQHEWTTENDFERLSFYLRNVWRKNCDVCYKLVVGEVRFLQADLAKIQQTCNFTRKWLS